MGAEVTAVDSPIKETMLRQLGVDHYIDYTQSDVTKQHKTYDIVFNMVANSRYAEYINLLNKNGRYLMGNPKLGDMLRALITTKLSDKKAIFALAGETIEELTTLSSMVEAGKIKSLVDKIYSMNNIVIAHQRVETEQRSGAVVLSFGVEIKTNN